MNDGELQQWSSFIFFIVCTRNFQIIVKESVFIDQLCWIIAIFTPSFKYFCVQEYVIKDSNLLKKERLNTI